MSEDAASPIELRAPSGARVVEIDWSDGTTSRYPHAILRAFCPCAHCQGHQGPIRWKDLPSLPSALELATIEEVGAYALRFGWGDGHATGLYTFRYLKQLATISERPEAEVRELTFGR